MLFQEKYCIEGFEAIKQLEKAGAGVPQGRLYHVCFGTGTNLRVLEVWESLDAFNAFGSIPILQQIGIDPGQPDISEVYNSIPG